MADPNYITRDGAKRLQEELHQLLWKDRSKVVQDVQDAAAQGDRSENAEYIYGKKKLREIDRRIRFLTKRLEAVEIVEPNLDAKGRIFFGATVEVEDETGARSLYVIVGEDETDTAAGRISWRSPVGRALLGKRKGESVVVHVPAGDFSYKILDIH